MGRNFLSPIILLFLSILITSCTRTSSDLQVNLTLPVQNQKASALAAGDQLETLIVNLHNVSGKPNPWFLEFNFEDKAFPGFVEIPGVTKGAGIVVQVLAVYENTNTGGTRIAYGAADADLSKSKDVNVSIKTQSESARMADLGGRYLSAAPPHLSGRLVGYYNPPDGRPKMKVWESEIIAGWFKAFALEESATASTDGTNAGVNFMVESFDGTTSSTLFENLRFRTVSTNVYEFATGPRASPVVIGTTDYRTLISKPFSFHNKGDGGLEEDGARLLMLGFFGPGASSGQRVCLPTVTEGLRFVKRLEGGSYVPMDVHIAGSTTGNNFSRIERLGGGVVESFGAHYGSFSSTCSSTNMNHFKVNHERLGSGVEEILGMRYPFKATARTNPQAEYITGDFGITVASQATLKWTILDGADSGFAPVQGYEVYARPFSSSNSNDDGGDHSIEIDQCSRLTKQGFSEIAHVPSAATPQASFASVLGTAVTAGNWTNFEYAVCAYTQVAGVKRHVGNYVRSSCLGNCDQSMHTGWAAANTTHTVTADEEFSSFAGSAQIQAVAAVSAPSSHLVQLQTPGDAFFTAGSEMVILVQSEGQSTSCGNFNGMAINPGQSHFARVVHSTSGSVYIQKGSWVDALIGNSNLGVTPNGGTNHCFVKATRVAHFRQFTINPGFALEADDLADGGAVALRVNGKMIMGNGSAIDAAESGFLGGDATYPNGGSQFGSVTSSYITGASRGFTSATNAAGGGGGGVAGNGGSNSLGGGSLAAGGASSMNMSSGIVLGYGGGGGGGFSSGPDTHFPGGAGGGWIFVTAQEFQGPSSGTAHLSARGESASGGSNSVAGGGGGGAVNFFAKSSTGKISLDASGGNGGDNNGVWQSAPGGAGNGGGGHIAAVICDLGGLGKTQNADVGWGASAGSNTWRVDYGDGSQDGPSKNIQTASTGSWNWYCRN